MQTGKSTVAGGSAAKSGSLTYKVPRRRSLEKGYVGYVMIAPFIIFFLAFSLYPVFNTVRLGFTNTTLIGAQKDFVGFDNFKILFKDRFFWGSIVTTWKIWLINFIPQLAISMVLSVWFTSSFLKLKAIGFWRSVLYLPNLLLPVTVGVLFYNIFDLYGPANQFLVRAGFFKEAFEFFRSENFSQLLVAFIQWWMWYGNTVIILVAAMTSISVSLYESAMIDGANGLKMFRYITLPSLRPILVYTLVTSLVGGLQMLDIPYLLSATGSPNGAIKTIYMVMLDKYNSNKKHIGMAASVGLCLLIMTTFSSLFIFYFLRDKDAISEKKARKVLQREQRLTRKAVL